MIQDHYHPSTNIRICTAIILFPSIFCRLFFFHDIHEDHNCSGTRLIFNDINRIPYYSCWGITTVGMTSSKPTP